MIAGLVDKMEKWEYSSFKNYIGLRNNSLCNIKLALEYLDLPKDKVLFYDWSNAVINKEKIKFIV